MICVLQELSLKQSQKLFPGNRNPWLDCNQASAASAYSCGTSARLCRKLLPANLVKYTLMKLALTFTLLLAAGAAQAQYANLEGDFASSTASLRILVLDPDAGVIAASSTVVLSACSGSLSGIGKMSGDVLQLKPYEKIEGGEDCVLTVKFNKLRNKATITEDRCSAFHGAACGWEGQSVTKRR